MQILRFDFFKNQNYNPLEQNMQTIDSALTIDSLPLTRVFLCKPMWCVFFSIKL